jgi:phosphoglycerate dehydrogenase-like enzyme
MRHRSWTMLAVASILSVGGGRMQTPGEDRETRQALPTVAIIGTGNVGSALGPRLAKLAADSADLAVFPPTGTTPRACRSWGR